MEVSELASTISRFLETAPLNRVDRIGIDRIFDSPLVAVAKADDPLFDELKEEHVVGPHHFRPSEWMERAVSVISYFLPFSEQVRRANRKPGLPAMEWLFARMAGENCNDMVRKLIVRGLRETGADAVVPVLDERFSMVDQTSNWSERHVAYVAGLGTFGLGRSLITQKGTAGRFGSVITDSHIAATTRPYDSYDEYCNSCGVCIDRCPSGAIREEGKEVAVCAEWGIEQVQLVFGGLYGCGKCQVAVPCESGIPVRKGAGSVGR